MVQVFLYQYHTTECPPLCPLLGFKCKTTGLLLLISVFIWENNVVVSQVSVTAVDEEYHLSFAYCIQFLKLDCVTQTSYIS